MLAAVERNELLLPIMRINLRGVIPRERNQTPKTSHHVTAFLKKVLEQAELRQDGKKSKEGLVVEFGSSAELTGSRGD